MKARSFAVVFVRWTPIKTHLDELPDGQVNTVVAEVPTFSEKAFLKLFAIDHPRAIARANALPSAFTIVVWFPACITSLSTALPPL